MSEEKLTEEIYLKADKESRNCIDNILNSKSSKKIIVAGPGTGKTFLFKEILTGKRNPLTLSFVKALVEDLSLELNGISDVKTLHSYARSILSRGKNEVKIFPKLSKVIEQDAKIMLKEEIDFDYIFRNKEDGNKHIDFYKKRKDYYDKYYGYTDVIYALVKYFESNKDNVPVYDQILIDEFQDFNKLEISLIDLLSEKSPILLAGDDDQALYEELKNASKKYIRERYINNNNGYEAFTLPFCRRCTRVIVETVNDIILSATSKGFLNERIKKGFKYFDSKDKDLESKANPKIIYTKKFDRQLAYFIEQQIDEIAISEKKLFQVLIISPTNLKSFAIASALKSKGFYNIDSPKKKEEDEPKLLDGLKLLVENQHSNLGWRVASKFFLDEAKFSSAIDESYKENPKIFFELIEIDSKKNVEHLLKLIRAVIKHKSIDNLDLELLMNKVGFNVHYIACDDLKGRLVTGHKRKGNQAIKKIPIKITTIPGSKGLAADYVFITHFDDQYFIKNKDNITDNEISNFLVTLTRARKKVILISSDENKEPTFLSWISHQRIQRI